MERFHNIIKYLPNIGELDCLKLDSEAYFILKLASQSIHDDKSINRQESSYLIQSLLDRTWEIINNGAFKNVSINTREIYSIASLFKIVFILLESTATNQIEKCFEILDKALLIGHVNTIYFKRSLFSKALSDYYTVEEEEKNEISLPYVQPLKPKDSICDISILNCPSVEYLNENFINKRIPVLLRNTIQHWPALTKWRDLNYLLKIAGNRLVPIESGSNYTAEDWSQDMVKIKDFLYRQFSVNDNSSIEYLAQHELFDQIPELKQDIRIPDYCFANGTDERNIDIKAWLGPKGTISPLHYDEKHNILCQVFGNKKIILASPDDSFRLYPNEGVLTKNTSQIDAENINFLKFPLVEKVRFMNLTLNEGECLYIPPKWWHFIKSLNKSFSVSFWWE